MSPKAGVALVGGSTLKSFCKRIGDARRRLLAANAIKICHYATFLFMTEQRVIFSICLNLADFLSMKVQDRNLLMMQTGSVRRDGVPLLCMGLAHRGGIV